MDDQDHYNRAALFRRKGEFFSGKVAWSQKWPRIRKLLPYCIGHTWRHGHDDLKSPMNNDAKPAYTSPAAVNFYNGDDRDLLPNGNSNRYSCGMGSGATTIGLYQPTMLINAMYPQLRELMDLVTKAMSEKDPLYAKMLKKHPFNVVSIKAYYWYLNENGVLERKTLRWHSDVVYINGVPCPQNSQIPGTPVGLLTHGARKQLCFMRGTSTDDLDPETLICLNQNSRTLLALDPRDELPKMRRGQQQADSWYHSSRAGDDKNGVTHTFCFRSCQTVREVTPSGNLAHPKVGPKKELQFAKAHGVFETKHYLRSRRDIEKKMLLMVLKEEMPWKVLSAFKKAVKKKRRRKTKFVNIK